MQHLLTGHDETVMQWARRKFPTLIEPRFAFGILDKCGTLKGAVLIVEETYHTADLGVFSDIVPGPGIARQVFRFLFEEMNYGRVEITIRRTDAKSRKAAPRWGFKYDGTAKDYWGPDLHAVRFVMLKEDCPFLRKSNGKAKICRSGLSEPASGRDSREAATVQHSERMDAGCLQSA